MCLRTLYATEGVVLRRNGGVNVTRAFIRCRCSGQETIYVPGVGRDRRRVRFAVCTTGTGAPSSPNEGEAGSLAQPCRCGGRVSEVMEVSGKALRPGSGRTDVTGPAPRSVPDIQHAKAGRHPRHGRSVTARTALPIPNRKTAPDHISLLSVSFSPHDHLPSSQRARRRRRLQRFSLVLYHSLVLS